MSDPTGFSCEEVFRRLDDFLDRELDPSEMALVVDHLERCERCAAEHAFEARILASLHSKLGQLRVPPGLLQRVAGVIRAERDRR